MKAKFILPLFLLFASLTVSAQQKSEFSTQIEAVLKMFNDKDASAINGVVVEAYTINRIPEGYESQVLPQVLEQIPPFSSYEIVSETKEDKGTRIVVNFINPQLGAGYPSNFLILDSNKKIQELNIIETALIQGSED